MSNVSVLSVNPTPKLTKEELVDAIAVQDAIASEAYTRSKELRIELLLLVGEKKQKIDGILHQASIVEESVQWKLNEPLIREKMGERWCNQHSKPCKRRAYILILGRKTR